MEAVSSETLFTEESSEEMTQAHYGPAVSLYRVRVADLLPPPGQYHYLAPGLVLPDVGPISDFFPIWQRRPGHKSSRRCRDTSLS